MLSESHVLIRRFLRFIYLPYFYVVYMNWSECKLPKLRVIMDFFYIFFKLKYFPDNYSVCRLWEKPREEWIYYYGSVYDAWQRWKLRKEVLPLKYRLIYDDKNICHLLCKANNIPVAISYGVVNRENFKKMIYKILNKNPNKTLIAKPIEGRGGKGILILRNQNGKIFVTDKNSSKQLVLYKFRGISVLQEYIVQHKNLSKISKSLNTVRIVTLLAKNNEIIFLGAKMRFGIGESFIDNTSQGGVSLNININEGKLGNIAFDNKAKRYHAHPTSKIVFRGCKIPYWEDVLSLAENVHRSLPYNKLLGQDIGISTEGPVLIELNAEYDNVMFEQTCGPILKNKKVKDEFERYNLLINKCQKKI